MTYKHEFFRLAISAFLKSLSETVSLYKNIPVYIINTGDEAYMVDWQKESKFYEVTPRIVVDIDAAQILVDQLSSPHEMGYFVESEMGREREFAAEVRRVPIQFAAPSKCVTDNLLESLEVLEALMFMFFKPNSFKFEHKGKTHMGEFVIDASVPNERNMTMGQDSQRRARELGFSFNLYLQLPCFDIYNSVSLKKSSNVMKTIIHNVIEEDTGETATQIIRHTDLHDDSQVIQA